MGFTKGSMPQIYTSRSGQGFDLEKLFSSVNLTSHFGSSVVHSIANHSPSVLSNATNQAKVLSPNSTFQGVGIANHLNKVA